MELWLEKIDCDLFDIAHRLKEIDGRYQLYFNRKLKRFEIYVGEALQIAVPFTTLDARTLEHTRKTRVENLRRLMEEIEEENRKKEEEATKHTVEKMAACF
ncbi:MAG: hypothetical protein RSB59_01880 [Clostridia bacterium]